MEQYNGMNDGNINISDIIEVIQTTDPGSMATIAIDSDHVQPYVEILEQPASKALRFRYECEGRSAGSIPGVNSTPENKTFPSIRIVGYNGRAMVVVSCVTKDAPDNKGYRPHPHNLVGKEVCKQGVCTVEVPAGNMVVTFSNLGIQCVKKKDIEEALRMRQELRVDPYRTGFEHKRHPTSIDLNAVRLCFQVFLEGSQKGKFNKPLPPIVSDPIYDKKAMSDLVICKLSHCSASVAGGMDMILLCEKVAKEDIQVRFFEERDGQLLWEGYGDFQPTHVHKQTAIAFRTPSYRTQQVEQPVQVYIQLRRPSDGATSEPLPFQMLPLGTGRPAFWSLRKAFARKKADYNTFSKILSTETALLANVTPKFPRNIDEFNNNDLDVKRSHDKISALRALNELYNVKNHIDMCNGDLKAIINSAQNVDQSTKSTVLDYQNNEVIISPESNVESKKEINKLYNLGENNVKNDTFTVNYKEGVVEGIPCAKPDVQNNSTTASRNVDSSKNRSDWFDYSEIGKWVQKGQACLKEKNNEATEIKSTTESGNKSLNEFLSQVAELDQIYADTHNKLIQSSTETSTNQMMDVDVCDNQTYTSLQMAMKNPIELFDITDDRKYEDVAIPEQNEEISVMSPTSTAKRDIMGEAEERLPPLPPKRIRKMPSMPLLPRPISAQTLNDSSFEAPNKNLPSLPGSLSKHAKQGLFSKLFAKKNKKDKCSGPSLSGDNDSSLSSLYSLKSIVQDDINSQLPRPSMTSVTAVKSLKLDGDESPPYGIDLTEAEHYALYTTMAPHATASEFDELSFYYSLVEGGKILMEDDADSLRRKRQKLSNNSSSILFKHVAETEKHARNQPISFNIVKVEPPGRISPFGGPTNTNAGNFGLQSSAQPHSNMQALRPQISPGRTPSPMEYSTYSPSLVQQQYQPNIQPIIPNVAAPTDVQAFSYVDQLQLQPEPNLLMVNRLTSENQEETQPTNNIGAAGASCFLDMDSQQFNFDWNSADLADFGANLSANLSTGLSISDSIQPEGGSNSEERNSMTERITWINQELSALNKILKPNRENDG